MISKKALIIISAIVGVFTFIALLYYKFSGQKVARDAYLALLQAQHNPVIDKLETQIEEQQETNSANAADVKVAKAAVEARKKKLREGMSDAGLSAQEIADRLGELEL